MPRGTFPPTPASSTDLQSQDGSNIASLQMSFELPPPAMASTSTNPSASASSASTSASQGVFAMQAFPVQASEAVKSRRRAAAPPKDQFVLPPPPTRTRKIIQVKPKEDSASAASGSGSKGGVASATSTATGPSYKSTAGAAATAAGVKKKQPSSTSAAGKKIARKTAHSLIERRRRSKMNEEFAVLKDLVPACTGEMHKLAILQASIEYVRYLEDCVAKLKAQRGAEINTPAFRPSMPSPSTAEPPIPDNNSYAPAANGYSPDVDMMASSSSAGPSPALTPVAGRSQQPSVSPAMLSENSRHRHNSCSSVSTEYRPLGYNSSSGGVGGVGGSGMPSMTSPSFGPQTYGYPPSSAHSASGSALTSPALPPLRDLDQEATAALLMLNQVDRRSSSTSTAGRGMSVKDLLST
ncbi:transcriptional regulator form adherence 6 [Cladorrhinum sp. PSN332]|nr:transcriptional regulator form adherence 6 [Cladorrhinum sp. PSN332]